MYFELAPQSISLSLSLSCLLQAGRVRRAADLTGESGWEEDIDDLLRDAAAAAAGGGFEW